MALRRGFIEAGANDNDIIIFSELMDSESLFLTANADTVYYVGIVDLSEGPMVIETPPDTLGVIDDMWFRHVIDFGKPGPDRGQGGRFLLAGPGYDGPLPDSGFQDWAYYPGSAWYNPLFIGGYDFDTPPPAFTAEGFKPYPPTGRKRLDARFSCFFFATGITRRCACD